MILTGAVLRVVTFATAQVVNAAATYTFVQKGMVMLASAAYGSNGVMMQASGDGGGTWANAATNAASVTMSGTMAMSPATQFKNQTAGQLTYQVGGYYFA